MCWQLAGVSYPNSHIEDRPGGSRKNPWPETFPKISRTHGIQSGDISNMICEQGSDFPGPRLNFYPVIVDLLHHVSVCVFLATFTVSHSRSTNLLPIGKKGIQSLLRVQDLEQQSVKWMSGGGSKSVARSYRSAGICRPVTPWFYTMSEGKWLTDGRLVRYTQLYVDMSLL